MKSLTSPLLACLAAALLPLAAASLPLSAHAQESIPAVRGEDAGAILDRLRMSQTLQNMTFRGNLRMGSTRTPFVLKLEGPTSTYTFSETGQGLRLSLGESKSTVEEISPGGQVTEVGCEKMTGKIGSTPLTYEDISLSFLYWPHATVEGEETISTRKCWKLWVATPPGGCTQYSGVYVWVDKGSGALMRADGYSPDRKLAKRFHVISAQKINNQWSLKQMRIEAYDPPGSGGVTRAYLEIDGAAE
jgi:hypothetical protein